MIINKPIVACFCVFIILSCGDEQVGNDKTIISGESLYNKHCAICHGSDGKLGSGGAKDLTTSTMGIEERISIIKNGKGGMTPFGSLLNEAEAKAVAEYLDNLK